MDTTCVRYLLSFCTDDKSDKMRQLIKCIHKICITWQEGPVCVCVWVCISLCVHACYCWTVPCLTCRVKIDTNTQLEEGPVKCYRKRCSQRDKKKSSQHFWINLLNVKQLRKHLNVTCPVCSMPLAQGQVGKAPTPPQPLTGKAVEIMDEWMEN